MQPELFRAFAWAAAVLLALAVVLLTIRSGRRWKRRPNARLRKLATSSVSQKEFRRSLATALLAAVAFTLLIVFYFPTLFRGSTTDTGWSGILQFAVPSSPWFAWLTLATTLIGSIVYYVVNHRFPRVVSASLWVAALIAVEIAAITTVSAIFGFNWVEITILVVVAALIPFYRALFDLLRLASNWIRIVWRRFFEVVRSAVLWVALRARNLQARIVRASQLLRSAVRRSEERLATASRSARAAEIEALLVEAEEKEAAGDDTVVKRKRRDKRRRGESE